MIRWFSLLAMCSLAGFLVVCDNISDKADMIHPKTPLEIALDSAEILFASPKTERIVDRIKSHVLIEKNPLLKMRGLRILSKVLLSRWVSSAAELDSAAKYVKQAEELALASGDSLQWALCQADLFRYENRIRNEFSKPKIRPKSTLLRAINLIEKSHLTDELSFAYRVLARRMLTDQEPIPDVLQCDLLALQFNDSAKYPELRAAMCHTMYATYFALNQPKDALKYLLRAKKMLQQLDDTVYYVYVTLDLASFTHDDAESLRYYHDALRVLKSPARSLHAAWANYGLGFRFQRMGIYDSAIYYSRRGIEKLLISPGDNRRDILMRQVNMAVSYAGLRQFDIAKRLAAIRDSLTVGNAAWEQATPPTAKRFDLFGMIKVYQMLGDIKNLTRVQAKLLKLQRGLYSSELMGEVGKAEKRYELKIKNEELKNLEKTSALKATAAERDERLRVLLIGVVAIAITGLLIIRSLLARKIKLQRSLTRQNATIERQKIGLENSLRNLQRTQAHILNSEKTVMLGHFTAGVAHELNNPLNFVSGGVSVFEEAAENAGEAITEKERELLRSIRQGVDRVMEVVNCLRVYCNPKSEIGFDSLSDVKECLNASLLVLQSKINMSEVEIVPDLSNQIVIGHSGQLCQVFINVIDNAVYAVKDLAKERKTIRIHVRKDDDNIRVDFQDRGPGIAESIRPNLFSAFFTTKPAGDSMGLGLFSCYAILRSIRGSISFTSDIGQGTTFTVRLARPK